MKEGKKIKKSLVFNVLAILATPFWLEGLMGFNRKMNNEFGHSGKLSYRLSDGYSDSYTGLYNNFESVIFPICVVLVLLLAGVVNFNFFKKYISENWLKPVFKFDLIFRLLIIALSLFTIYQFNLTDFWDDNIFLYRATYLLTLVLPTTLIYEFMVNKGKTIFSDISYKMKQENIDSDEKKLVSLKEMNIITEGIYTEEIEKINTEKELIEIRNSKIYKEFKSNLDFAISKGLLNKDEKTTKLLEKEQELLNKRNF